MLCELILENDLNPYIVFDSNAKVVNANKEGEFLLNFITPKKLFDIALIYASKEYGINYKFKQFIFDKLVFYAIMVAYIDDEYIALRLFKSIDKIKNTSTTNLSKINIFNLIELAKNTSLIDSNIQIIETYDTSIPEFNIDIKNFLIIINKIFDFIKHLQKIELKVLFKVGEYTIIKKHKVSLISIKFIIFDDIDLTLLNIPQINSNINIFISKQNIELEVPFIEKLI
jgi:hypothetical protein